MSRSEIINIIKNNGSIRLGNYVLYCFSSDCIHVSEGKDNYIFNSIFEALNKFFELTRI